jgi:hypothetical protein
MFQDYYGHEQEIESEMYELVKIRYIKKTGAFESFCIGKAQIQYDERKAYLSFHQFGAKLGIRMIFSL